MCDVLTLVIFLAANFNYHKSLFCTKLYGVQKALKSVAYDFRGACVFVTDCDFRVTFIGVERNQRDDLN